MASLPANVALANIADGANIVASDHRNNYSAIQTFVNALNAILSGGTSGQVLGSSGGTTIGWQAGSTAYRKSTAKAVNTTVAATDLLNGEITLAAGVMGATGMLRLSAFGDYLNNSGGTAAPPRFQLLFGGATLFDTGAAAVAPAAATRATWTLDVLIGNTSAAVQFAKFDAKIWSVAAGLTGAVSQAATTGEGTLVSLSEGGGWGGLAAVLANTGAVNTALATALVLNVINGSASAAYETKLFGAIVEVI